MLVTWAISQNWKKRTLIQLDFSNLELNMGLNQLIFLICGHERFYVLWLGLSNK